MNRRRFLTLLAPLAYSVTRAQNMVKRPEEMSLEEFRAYLGINPYNQDPLPMFAARIAEEKNAKMQAHYLATSFLGFWLKGDEEMAKKSLTALRTHHPDSFYIEQLSPDRMMKACPDCRRANQRKVTCPTCNGTNVCATCKGKKVLVRMGRKKPCHVCNSTGKCPDCDNRGFIRTGSCRTCNGTFEVVNKERLMIGYKQMLKMKESRIKQGNRNNIFGRRNRPNAPQAGPE